MNINIYPLSKVSHCQVQENIQAYFCTRETRNQKLNRSEVNITNNRCRKLALQALYVFGGFLMDRKHMAQCSECLLMF